MYSKSNYAFKFNVSKLNEQLFKNKIIVFLLIKSREKVIWKL